MIKKALLSLVATSVFLTGCTSTNPTSSAVTPATNTPASSTTPATTPTTTTSDSAKTYTLADVAKHSKSSDCWLAVDGTVYDATSFVTKHPGGAEILKGCGKDATALFKGEREHKAEATEMLKTLEIGKLGE